MVEIPICWRRVDNDLLRDRIWALKEKESRGWSFNSKAWATKGSIVIEVEKTRRYVGLFGRGGGNNLYMLSLKSQLDFWRDVV